MTPEQIIFGFMGAVALWLLNGIRQDNKDIRKELGDHLKNRNLHTWCGKEHGE